MKNYNDFYIPLMMLMVVLVSFVTAAILMWLWNMIIVELFSTPVITYWQAYGLYLISNILLKPFSVGSLKKNDKSN